VAGIDFRALFFGAHLCLLTLLAYFCAVSVNSLVALWLALPPPSLQSERELPLSSAQRTLPLSAYAIVYTRDIFNAVKAPVQATGVTAASKGPFKLLGTAMRDRDYAFAIIEDHTSQVQGLYREGQTIAPGVTLVQVEWDRAVIKREGRRETLLLPTEPPSPASAREVRAPSPPPSEPTSGVSQVAPDTFQIERQEVDRAMANLNEIFTQVRAVPYTTADGVPQGFRLFSIKVDSLIDRLGFKNGDIVQRVNGVEVTDPSTAFTLLQDLQGHSQVRVDVLRNHQPVTLSYEIR
jgi:general secretion pathway protein C